MTYRCHVCESQDTSVVYRSAIEKSLTSGCQILPVHTQIYECASCGHVYSEDLPDAAVFYAEHYNINLYHEDEDQLYEVVDGVARYRTDHQLAVMQRKIQFQSQQKVLDFGCAKSSMMKKMLELYPDLDCHFYDVSEAYRPYWEKMTTPDKCAVNTIPRNWLNRFDLITSFFSLEHIASVKKVISEIASLLNEGGTFYAIVPNMFNNVADFIVVDHVNHFTPKSMQRLLNDAGLSLIDIDLQSHRGAMTIVAKKRNRHNVEVAVEDCSNQVAEIASFWRDIGNHIQSSERNCANPFAIYGAGFYGAFVHAHLLQPEKVVCFLDNNDFLQNRSLFNIVIKKPVDIPTEVETVFVALNPKIARNVMATMPFISETRTLIYMAEH